MKDTRLFDLFVGIGIIALGIAVYINASNMPSARLGLGPGGYPMFLAVLLIIMGVILTVSILRKGGVSFKIKLPKDKAPTIKIVVTGAATFLYLFLMSHLGFILVTPFYLIGIMALFGYRRYIISVPVSVILTICVFYLFTRVFFIFLPTFGL